MGLRLSATTPAALVSLLHLQTDLRLGLSDAVVRQRLAEWGYNELPEKKVGCVVRRVCFAQCADGSNVVEVGLHAPLSIMTAYYCSPVVMNRLGHANRRCRATIQVNPWLLFLGYFWGP